MANNINLLPTDFRVNKDIAHTAVLITRLAVVAGIILLIVGAAGGGIFLFIQTKVKETETTSNNLKSQIQGLETTEQKFILVKDRVTKSQSILSQRGKFVEFANYLEFVKTLPSGTTFVDEELDSSVSKIILNVSNSADLATIIDLIGSSTNYVRASIESIDFDPSKGYELTLNLF